ncbi:site-specific integrase [Paractinoplanes durhamensis]|uniref:Phage integrase n=1 Tax=Paractinoplanes durhamensis TaxID=113563 RepID=A0ABQ3Z8Y6_9ACTN|nr:tyrosine-type recombinase/integrase [Actinoplanes durhamensis]GIE06246.1 phage integrase [Actinoplanes durhamensis]
MGRPVLPLGTAGKVRYIAAGVGWIARCGFRDYDGTTRTVERTGPTKPAAERRLKEALRDRTQHDRDADINPDTKLRVVAEAWWAGFVADGKTINSKRVYRLALENQILPHLANLRCREFSVGVSERFLRRVETEFGNSVAKTTRSVLSSMCAFAARLDAMDRNPVRDTSPISVKPKKGDPKALSVAQWRQLRAYVTYDPRAVRRDIPDLIDFMSATGERLGECLAVDASAVDVEAKSVAVLGTVIHLTGVGVAVQRAPKSEAGERTIALPDWAWPMVQRRLANAVQMVVRVIKIDERTELLIAPRVSKAGQKRTEPKEWLKELLDSGQETTEVIKILFPTSVGSIRDPSNASRDVKAALGYAGLSGDTSHLLRKSVATQMNDAGVPIRLIADQLGHARASMTEDYYFGRQKQATAGAPALESLGF